MITARPRAPDCRRWHRACSRSQPQHSTRSCTRRGRCRWFSTTASGHTTGIAQEPRRTFRQERSCLCQCKRLEHCTPASLAEFLDCGLVIRDCRVGAGQKGVHRFRQAAATTQRRVGVARLKGWRASSTMGKCSVKGTRRVSAVDVVVALRELDANTGVRA